MTVDLIWVTGPDLPTTMLKPTLPYVFWSFIRSEGNLPAVARQRYQSARHCFHDYAVGHAKSGRGGLFSCSWPMGCLVRPGRGSALAGSAKNEE
ncbi:MAG: hypothetical protein DME21_12510 [Verrucomicrobia bacterium]|nr:MAG: hypothetical protein DME21_12510 [Verrucomicrobiota bacterium]